MVTSEVLPIHPQNGRPQEYLIKKTKNNPCVHCLAADHQE